MSRPRLGKTVVDGVLMRTSPSALALADPDSGGCPRSWFYRYVENRKSPTSKAQLTGIKNHAAIERFLTDDVDEMGPMITPIRCYIPPTRLAVKIMPADVEAQIQVMAVGIPVDGFVDFCNRNTDWRVLDGGKITRDPGGTVEVIDWKFTSDLKWAKSALAMSETIQMTTYGLSVLTDECDHVRLSHVYACTRKRDGLKSTMLVKRATLDKRWEHIEAVARTIIDIASEREADAVSGNLSACDSYGGCPHRTYCPDHRDAMTSFFRSLQPNTPKETPMNLLDQLTGAKPPDTAAPTPALADALAKLKAGEQTATPAPVIADMIKTIREAGYGTPSLGGALAREHAAQQNLELQSDWLAGTGQLGKTSVSTRGDLQQIINEICKEADKPVDTAQAPVSVQSPQTPAVPALLPSDTPASAPVAPVPVVAVDAPVDTLVVNAPVDTPVDTGQAPLEKELKKLKKRELLLEALKIAARCNLLIVENERLERLKQPQAPAASVAPVTAAEPTGIRLFVNCSPIGLTDAPARLEPFVDATAKLIADHAKVPDIRAAGDKSPLSFGKWKGVLAATIRESKIPPGDYVVDSRGSELAEVVVEALRPLCSLFVRGV